MKQLVFTFVGNDKPGLVEQLSAIVSAHNGNWLESRLANLANKFAGIVSVSVSDSDEAALSAALSGLAADGLVVVVESTTSQSSTNSEPGLLSVMGNDRPGIVKEISQALAAKKINIQELTSQVESAPMAGIPLFSAQISVEIPKGADLEGLEGDLEDIANTLDLDIYWDS